MIVHPCTVTSAPLTVRRRWRPGATLVAALGAFLFAPFLPRALAQESCVSVSCHATTLRAGNVHAATEACDNCHTPLTEGAPPHPQKGKRTFKLSSEPPALCADCHDALGTKSTVHSPVREGMCTRCHDPHSSNEPKLLTAPASELCATCHSDPLGHKLPHGPVSAGDCLACHTPHESQNPRLLTRAGDELCFTCHGDIRKLLEKKNVHPAIDSGCTSCHDPHGAAYPKLLAEQGAGICTTCHDTIAEKAQQSPVPHAPLESPENCASCHSAHASDAAKLLLKPEKELCLDCHKTVLTAAMTALHGPINEGKCTACHEPHGAQNRNLLAKGFPAEGYVPYTDAAYGLCFSCHRRDLLQYPDTSFATGFRDGERNLHFLHVNNPQKGRSCKLCHAPHGGRNDRLIADSVPFGQWTLPLKFVKTENGGMCSPGCHKPLHYDRKSPGKRPEAPKPANPKGG
jgi:predicted CXXCH cytochrome family protein